MGSPVATLLVLAFLVPAGVVFVIAYRHALRHWLVRPDAHLPPAVVASSHVVFARRDAGRRFHAAAIATAFASVFVMGAIAAAMVITAIVGA